MRCSLLEYLAHLGGKLACDVGSGGRRTDRNDARCLGHLGRSGEHRRPAQAVSDQQRGRRIAASQVVRSRHQITDVRRKVGIGELPLTAADPSEVKAQYGNVTRRQTPGNPEGREDVLAAGETVREQGEGAGL